VANLFRTPRLCSSEGGERVAPGDYGVFAWADVESGAWQDPEFMRLYEGRGVSIRMGEGGRGRIDVVASPPGP
jgi:hypothetical protein